MIATPGRYFDHFALLEELPGGTDKIHSSAQTLLDVEQLFELVDLLHGFVGVDGGRRHQMQRFCQSYKSSVTFMSFTHL